MVFNSIFVQKPASEDLTESVKTSKVSNSNYLFSDIIKVFLGEQTEGEAAADAAAQPVQPATKIEGDTLPAAATSETPQPVTATSSDDSPDSIAMDPSVQMAEGTLAAVPLQQLEPGLLSDFASAFLNDKDGESALPFEELDDVAVIKGNNIENVLIKDFQPVEFSTFTPAQTNQEADTAVQSAEANPAVGEPVTVEDEENDFTVSDKIDVPQDVNQSELQNSIPAPVIMGTADVQISTPPAEIKIVTEAPVPKTNTTLSANIIDQKTADTVSLKQDINAAEVTDKKLTDLNNTAYADVISKIEVSTKPEFNVPSFTKSNLTEKAQPVEANNTAKVELPEEVIVTGSIVSDTAEKLSGMQKTISSPTNTTTTKNPIFTENSIPEKQNAISPLGVNADLKVNEKNELSSAETTVNAKNPVNEIVQTEVLRTPNKPTEVVTSQNLKSKQPEQGSKIDVPSSAAPELKGSVLVTNTGKDTQPAPENKFPEIKSAQIENPKIAVEYRPGTDIKTANDTDSTALNQTSVKTEVAGKGMTTGNAETGNDTINVEAKVNVDIKQSSASKISSETINITNTQSASEVIITKQTESVTNGREAKTQSSTTSAKSENNPSIISGGQYKNVVSAKSEPEIISAEELNNTLSVSAGEQITETINSAKPAAAAADDAKPAKAMTGSTKPVTVATDSAKQVATMTDSAKTVSAVTDSAKPVTVATDSAKPVSAVTDSAKPVTVATDSAKPVSAVTDNAKPVSAVTDSAKPVTVATDSAKPVTVATDSAKPVTVATDSAKPVATMTDSAKPVSAVTDSSKPVAIIGDSVNTETSKTEGAFIQAEQNGKAKIEVNLTAPEEFEHKSSAISGKLENETAGELTKNIKSQTQQTDISAAKIQDSDKPVTQSDNTIKPQPADTSMNSSGTVEAKSEIKSAQASDPKQTIIFDKPKTELVEPVNNSEVIEKSKITNLPKETVTLTEVENTDKANGDIKVVKEKESSVPKVENKIPAENTSAEITEGKPVAAEKSETLKTAVAGKQTTDTIKPAVAVESELSSVNAASKLNGEEKKTRINEAQQNDTANAKVEQKEKIGGTVKATETVGATEVDKDSKPKQNSDVKPVEEAANRESKVKPDTSEAKKMIADVDSKNNKVKTEHTPEIKTALDSGKMAVQSEKETDKNVKPEGSTEPNKDFPKPAASEIKSEVKTTKTEAAKAGSEQISKQNPTPSVKAEAETSAIKSGSAEPEQTLIEPKSSEVKSPSAASVSAGAKPEADVKNASVVEPEFKKETINKPAADNSANTTKIKETAEIVQESSVDKTISREIHSAEDTTDKLANNAQEDKKAAAVKQNVAEISDSVKVSAEMDEQQGSINSAKMAGSDKAEVNQNTKAENKQNVKLSGAEAGKIKMKETELNVSDKRTVEPEPLKAMDAKPKNSVGVKMPQNEVKTADSVTTARKTVNSDEVKPAGKQTLLQKLIIAQEEIGKIAGKQSITSALRKIKSKDIKEEKTVSSKKNISEVNTEKTNTVKTDDNVEVKKAVKVSAAVDAVENNVGTINDINKRGGKKEQTLKDTGNKETTEIKLSGQKEEKTETVSAGKKDKAVAVKKEPERLVENEEINTRDTNKITAESKDFKQGEIKTTAASESANENDISIKQPVKQAEHAQSGGVKSAQNAVPVKETMNENLPQLMKTLKAVEIAKEVQNLIESKQKGTFSFQLDPENLGKMKVMLSSVEQVISAKIEVQNEGARQALEQNIQQLFKQLEQNGVQVQSVQISLQQHDQRQPKQQMGKRKYNGTINGGSIHADADAAKRELGYNTVEYLV